MDKRYKCGTHIHQKGYPRVSAGPLRDRYIHRIVAAAMLRRELHKSEQIHHLDGNKLNYHWTNLLVVGERDHGWLTAKQAWFMQEKDRKAKAAWDAFMVEEKRNQDCEIIMAGEGLWQMSGEPIQKRWEAQHG